jgi:CheY-like chemotaxis protein
VSRSRAPIILCIDDHLSGLVGRQALLEQCGYKVLPATGGREGLALFKKNPVTAVIVDYQMPGMNGDVVAAKIKNLRSEVPIMLLSGHSSPPRRKLKSVDRFLSKSESPANFISAVEVLLQDGHKPPFKRWLDDWRFRISRSLRAPASLPDHRFRKSS